MPDNHTGGAMQYSGLVASLIPVPAANLSKLETVNTCKASTFTFDIFQYKELEKLFN